MGSTRLPRLSGCQGLGLPVKSTAPTAREASVHTALQGSASVFVLLCVSICTFVREYLYFCARVFVLLYLMEERSAAPSDVVRKQYVIRRICQHTSAYVSIRLRKQYVIRRICQHTSAYVSIRLRKQYVIRSICQHTSAYVSISLRKQYVIRRICQAFCLSIRTFVPVKQVN